MTSVVRALGAFGKFWRDFLIGDAPELFVGTLVFVGAALAFRPPWLGRRRRAAADRHRLSQRQRLSRPGQVLSRLPESGEQPSGSVRA